MKLFVAGLPLDMDEQELHAIFADYGQLTSAKIITDKNTQQSRGFGFVEFWQRSDAEKAITALHGGEIEGKPITVKPAENRSEANKRGEAKPRTLKRNFH